MRVVCPVCQAVLKSSAEVAQHIADMGADGQHNELEVRGHGPTAIDPEDEAIEIRRRRK